MGDPVCIAYLHQQDVSHSWHVSYMASFMYDNRPGGPRHLQGEFLAQYGTEMAYEHARNKVVKAFLDGYESDWLWWVDSDMGWTPDGLERLMSVADPVERPIVGGLCFGASPAGEDGTNGHVFNVFPTVYSLGEKGFHPMFGYPVNEAVQVDGTGSAFILIHRSVFQRIRDEFGDVWYDRLPHPDNDVPFGEDLSFCLRAALLGLPVFVHTGARTNHHKFHYLNEATFLAALAAPPATVPTAVLVPVIDRPQNAEPFMRSLRASTGVAAVYAVCEPNDWLSRAAWQKAGATVLVQADGRPGSFAAKINDGYLATTEPYVFIVGDDVTFTPGWLDHAQHIATIRRASVVGTNDMLNPRVMSGQHATHILIDRGYIDEVGASWEGPGVVCFEGYGHWFVDDEIVSAAKQRDRWAMALAAVVPHHHPIGGKVATDPVYEKGQSTAARDKVIYRKRLAQQKVPA